MLSTYEVQDLSKEMPKRSFEPQELVDHLHLRHRFKVGSATAERLKLELSAALGNDESDTLIKVRGLDETNGLPKTIEVLASELSTAWTRYSESVLSTIRSALSETPPELSHDILEDGITLTGGAAMTGLLARRVHEATGISTSISAAPLHSVAAGLCKVLAQRI